MILGHAAMGGMAWSQTSQRAGALLVVEHMAAGKSEVNCSNAMTLAAPFKPLKP